MILPEFKRTEIKYREGIANSLDLSQTYNQYLTIQIEYLTAILDLLNKKAELENRNNKDYKKNLELARKRYIAHREILDGLKSWNAFSEYGSDDLDFFTNSSHTSPSLSVKICNCRFDFTKIII